MRITVRFLGYLCVEFGCKEMDLDLPAGACIADAMARVVERLGSNAGRTLMAAGGSGYSVLFSLNSCAAERSSALSDGDNLALFPPSAGGCATWIPLANRPSIA